MASAAGACVLSVIGGVGVAGVYHFVAVLVLLFWKCGTCVSHTPPSLYYPLSSSCARRPPNVHTASQVLRMRRKQRHAKCHSLHTSTHNEVLARMNEVHACTCRTHNATLLQHHKLRPPCLSMLACTCRTHNAATPALATPRVASSVSVDARLPKSAHARGASQPPPPPRAPRHDSHREHARARFFLVCDVFAQAYSPFASKRKEAC